MVISLPPVRARLGADDEIRLPAMIPVHQQFPAEVVGDRDQAIRNGLSRIEQHKVAGKHIALAAGSRGIAEIGPILSGIVAYLKSHGAEVFVVPAMGSHGGATAQGQQAVLNKLGLTEDYLRAPIRSSMEVVELGKTEHGLEVFCDALAIEADGIIICNRIKPHNVFKADYESGLVKMLVVGLGKHRGAIAAHQLGFERFGEIFPTAAKLCLSSLPVLGGIGIVENGYGQAAMIETLLPEEILGREPELLRESKKMMGHLLVNEIDVLLVDEIGKDISGGGLDANVTGRSPLGLPGFTAPSIGRIIVRDLTEATAGNGIGIGLADFTTRRCVEKIDLATTYTNALTAHSLLSPKIPVVTENDREALYTALKTLRGGIPDRPLIARIKNTKKLDQIWLSEPYSQEIAQNSDLEAAGPPERLRFDDSGALITE